MPSLGQNELDSEKETLGPTSKIWRLWAPLWQAREKWGGLFFPFWTLFGMELLLSPYLLTNWIATTRGVTVWDPKTVFVLGDGSFLDHAIPFIDWSILIYVTIFAFYFALPFSAPRNDVARRELLTAVQFIVLSSWLAYLVFLLFPAEVDLRSQVKATQATSAWVTPLYEWFHWLDRPYNAWPSLHVTQTFLAAIAISKWWKARGLYLRVATMWILWATLTVSTLTTKQHFLWDALSGLVLGLGTWWFGFRLALRPQNIFGDQNQPVESQS